MALAQGRPGVTLRAARRPWRGPGLRPPPFSARPSRAAAAAAAAAGLADQELLEHDAQASREAAAHEHLHFMRVQVRYDQTASRVQLAGGDALVRRYMERSRHDILMDIARGRGDWTVKEVDRESGTYVVYFPDGKWRAPGGLGRVDLTGPEVLMVLEDAVDEAPTPFPRGPLPSWHQARVRIRGKLTNGRRIARASVNIPLAPPIEFDVSAEGSFAIELGFAGEGDGQGAQVIFGSLGGMGLALPRIPGAGTLMSIFCPVYVRKAMTDAAEGLATRFRELFAPADADADTEMAAAATSAATSRS